MRPLRFFLIAAVLHLVLTVATLIIAVGSAYGSMRGWGEDPLGHPAAWLADLLTAPIRLGGHLAAGRWRPDFGMVYLALNSALWAAVVTGARLGWHRWRSRPAV